VSKTKCRLRDKSRQRNNRRKPTCHSKDDQIHKGSTEQPWNYICYWYKMQRWRNTNNI